MGLIEKVLTLVFGGGRNAISETAQVFRVHAENQAERDTKTQEHALEQFAGEFKQSQRGLFDRVMDGLNRVPRPALALGTLGLFLAAMIDPVWFAARMTGIALVPEPLWWLLGAIVSFYFGARHQTKGQEFQREVARSVATIPGVVAQLQSLEALKRGAGDPGGPQPPATARDDAVNAAAQIPGAEALGPDESNAALAEWRAIQAARPATT